MNDEWRGPHQGKELELMLYGNKKVALVEPQRLKQFLPYIKSGEFIFRTMDYGWDEYYRNPDYIIAKADQRYRMNKLHAELMKDTRDHVKIGLLFGYEKDHIRKFVEFMKEIKINRGIDYVNGVLNQ